MLPTACANFTAGSSRASGASGRSGGAWGHCAHLRHYGLNVDFGAANFLLQLQPRTSLEFGCGLGLYTGFLRTMAGTAAIGIEPNRMPAIGFRGAAQLAANVIGGKAGSAGAEERACEAALGTFDLVFSIEVAEHLPSDLHGTLADMLVRHTRGFLVFSAGRPGQKGIGLRVTQGPHPMRG